MKRDTQIFDLIAAERSRQMHGIELIASENFVSEQVMEAMGSVLTNKYAEGYPAARYYGGCEVVDKVETLAIERICRLYGAEYANVQPHSGAQANMAVFFAVLQPGDTFMGLDLAHGGHLSHGSPVNMSGKYFQRRGLPARRGHGRDRLRRHGAQGAGMQAETDRRRRFGLFARMELQTHARNRGQSRRAAARGHGPHGRPDRRRAAGQPREIRAYRHFDDPQDPARTARRHYPHGQGFRRTRGDSPRPRAR